MNITVREATVEDAEVIAELSRETFYETFVVDNSKEDMDKFMNEQFTKEALMAEVGAAGNIFLLAYSGDEVAGYVRLREKDAESLTNSIEIARLYAASNMIGKGVGKALMKACITTAKSRNKQTIWLGVWEKNQRAINFYKAFGFEKFAEHEFLLGNDLQTDWLMKRQIS